MVNFNQFLKQAQGMQKKMQEMQEKLADNEYVGKAGGGMVVVTINGKTEMKKIEIDQSLFKPEEKEMVEDLVRAAFNDAKQKATTDSESSLNGALGGMSLPPGFKMPL